MASAEELKLSGNACFQHGDYVGADKFYTQAIIKDPTNAAFFTNRALARLRMELWEAVVVDCEKALELRANNLKAYTYLGTALLKLGRAAESFTASSRAYHLALEQRSPSVSQIAAACLDAKKARWEQDETRRIANESRLLEEAQSLFLKAAEGQGVDREEEAKERCRELENVFGQAEAERLKRREVPDWLVDNISFGIMWDPVITKNGHSYDRVTILDHLRRSQTDPLTREPLTEADLRPNLALKAASEQFLKENGWAVDW